MFAKVGNIDKFDEQIKNDLYNNEIINEMEDKTKISYNGYRNNEMI